MKKRMITTMAAMICCLVTVSLTAHAVFRYSAQTGGISIQIAEYAVQTEVQFVEAVTASTPSVAAFALDEASDVGSQEADSLEENGELVEPDILKADSSYKFPGHGTAGFTITPNGTAAEGYVIVNIVTSEGEETYYTGQILKDTSYSFSITAKEGTIVKIEAVWGICSVNSDDNTANAEMQLIEPEAAIELVTAEELNELTATPTAAPTPEPTATPAPTATLTPEPTAAIEPTATPEASLEPTATPEASLEPTATPEASLEPTTSPEATASPSPEATIEPTTSPTEELTDTPSPSPEQIVEPTMVPNQSLETTIEPTATPELTGESAMTLESTATPSPEPTEKPME